MKTVITVVLAITFTLAAVAQDSNYATIAHYKDGRVQQVWKPMTQQACMDHLKVDISRSLPDRGQGVDKMTCEKIDTVVTKHVKEGNATTKSTYTETTKAACQTLIAGPLKADAPGVTYTCDKK